MADTEAHYDRDPACRYYFLPLLYFKGFQALQAHRVGHCLWKSGRQALAYYLQSRVSEVFDLDIHPAAKIGNGLMLDHASGIVIGETVTIGDNVSLLHSVTLGGCGISGGDRHPKVENNVFISAGAKILGPVTIGENVKIGAGSMVVDDVPADSTVVGVPAKITKRSAVPV